MKCPNKKHPDWKALESRYGETGAYQLYVKNGFEIPSRTQNLTRPYDSKQSSKDLNDYVKSMPIEVRGFTDSKFRDMHVNTIANKVLSNVASLSGVNIQFVSNEEISNLREDLLPTDNSAASGLYDPITHTAYLNIESSDLGTYVHEAFAHPFMIALKTTNPTLYRNLIDRATAMEDVDAEIKSRGYSKEVYDSGIEHFAYAIEKHFSNIGSKVGDSTTSLKRFENALKVYFKEFATFIRDLFGLNKLENLSNNLTFGQLADIITYSNENYFLDSFSSKDSTAKLEARLAANPTSNTSEILDLFADNNNQMSFDDANHVYTNTQTGEEYVSISKMRIHELMGDDYDDSSLSPEEKSKNEAIYTRSSVVGTALHAFVEDFFNGKTFDASRVGAGIHPDVQKELIRILSVYLNHYEFISSEQRVYDHSKKLAGTIDLLLRDKKTGEILQLDIKTKASNYHYDDGTKAFENDKTNFEYYSSTTFAYSDHDKHFFQQWSYKRMQQLLGVKIDTIGIIPIEIHVAVHNDDSMVITGAKVTDALPLEDGKYFKLNPYATPKSSRVRAKVDAMLDLEKDSLEQEFQTNDVQRLHDLARKGVVTLEGKLAYLAMEDRKSESDLLKDQLDVLSEKIESPAEKVYKVMEVVNNLLIPYINEYNKNKEAARSGLKAWSLDTMDRWKKYADSFIPMIDDIVMEYNHQPEVFAAIDGFNRFEFEGLIHGTRDYLTSMSNAYRKEGVNKMLDEITPFSKTVQNRYWNTAREIKIKEYLEKYKHDKSTVWDDDAAREYADDYVKRFANSIANETRAFLQEQALIADDDVGYIYRWADTIFRSKDPLVGTMAKYFYDTYSANNRILLDMNIDLTNIMNEFDEAYPSRSYSDQKEVYDYLLDFDEEGHAFIVTEFSRKFLNAKEAYQTVLNETAGLSDVEMMDLMNAWLDTNAPYEASAYDRMHDQRLVALEAAKEALKITDEEYQTLYTNEMSATPAFISVLMQQGVVNREGAYFIRDKYREIEFENRTPDKTLYNNDKFENLMKLPDTDPKKKLYDWIRKESHFNDITSPQKFRLGNRIPGIRKSMEERLVDGQSLLTVGKGWRDDTFKVKEDDDTRGVRYLAGNELNQAIDNIPIHYTAVLEAEDQSYDIPTIFYKWTSSVHFYSSVKTILPTLEFIKDAINTRDIKQSRGGKIAKNIRDVVFMKETSKLPTEESYITKKGGRLAEQVNDWFTAHIYKNSDRYIGEFAGYDIAKILRAMQSMTSTKVMGFNLLSAANNMVMAEVSQLVEVASGSIMKPTTYAKATDEYRKEFSGVIADIGQRKFKSKLNLALEYFGIFDHMAEVTMRDKSIFKRLFKESALHATTLMGEHEAQGRFLIGALMEKEVFDKNNNSLGNLWDNLIITDEGYLKLNPEIRGNYNEIQNSVSRVVLDASWSMHGNYTGFSSTAMSMHAVGSMLQQFRKWYIPGFQRRFDRKHFSEFAEKEKYGFIRGGLNYFKNRTELKAMDVLTLFGKSRDEAKALKLEMATNWKIMSDVEKQTVIKLITETAILGMTGIMVLLIGSYQDDDDYKKNASELEKNLVNQLHYQAYRLTVELRSYYLPTELLTMIQNPMPTASLAESYIGVLYQALADISNLEMDIYKTGKRKGQTKLGWKLYNQIPVVRQLYRVARPEESLQALKQ